MSTRKILKVPRDLRVLEVAASLVVLLTLAQGFVAGMFVTGDVDLLVVHNVVAGAVAITGLTQLIVAVKHHRARPPDGRRHSSWLLILAALVFAVTVIQIALGVTRLVAPHFFLALVLTALAAAMLVLVFTEDPAGGLPTKPAAAFSSGEAK